MSVNSNDFGLFIDGIRLDRNMSREDLIDGIVSLSQYKRYLRGATSIPNTILLELADRLKFSVSELYMAYSSKQDIQYKKIYEVYLLNKQYKYEEAYEKAKKLVKEKFITSLNKLFFDFCYIKTQYNLELASDIQVLGKLSELVDYPNCIKNETFNWVEINILLHIARISARMDNYEASNLLYDILTSDDFKFIYNDDSAFLPVVYAGVAAILGRQSRIDEVIEVVDRGIEHCLQFQTMAALSTLFLTKAYALQELGKVEDAIKCGKMAIMQAFIEKNDKKYNQFKESLEKELNTKLDFLE